MFYLVTHSVQQYKPGELPQFLGYIYFQQEQHIFHEYLVYSTVLMKSL